eukprot:gb/GECH01000059.1/.p1 GENE.gb/GECH01000059.1/~~gb/GECH01000059.1/.p1  ORF type:complete len:155 (+),score=39.64 gb/GECH01000059.1/:1-465(+)
MTNRLIKEYKEQQKNREKDIYMVPDEENIFRWKAFISGPPDTPFEGGVWELELQVPSEYPISAPSATFNTQIFHPNVHFKTGEVCLDILKTQWSPAWTLQSVCRAIITLLAHPEADSPLNCDAGNLIRHGDHRGFRSMAKMYTKLKANQPFPSL